MTQTDFELQQMKIYKSIKISATNKKGGSWPVIVETEGGNYLVKLSG